MSCIRIFSWKMSLPKYQNLYYFNFISFYCLHVYYYIFTVHFHHITNSLSLGYIKTVIYWLNCRLLFLHVVNMLLKFGFKMFLFFVFYTRHYITLGKHDSVCQYFNYYTVLFWKIYLYIKYNMRMNTLGFLMWPNQQTFHFRFSFIR